METIMTRIFDRALRHLATALVIVGIAAAAPHPVHAASTSKKTVCSTCGTIRDIRAIEQEGEGTGLGAVAGGVAGALVGSQIGQGTGNTVATVAGAAGGAYAGHQIEKKVRKTKHYEVVVKMDNGSTRIVKQNEEPAFAIGDKVKVVNGKLQPR